MSPDLAVYIHFLPRHCYNIPEMFQAKVLSSTGPGCESTGLGWESTGPGWESSGLGWESTGPRMWKYWTLDGKVLVLGCANYFPELLPKDIYKLLRKIKAYGCMWRQICKLS